MIDKIVQNVYFIEMKHYISTSEAAKIAGVGVSSIKRWVDEERVQSIRTPGGHRRVEKRDFVRFLQKGESSENESQKSQTGSLWADRILTLDVFGLQAELLRSRGQLGTWFNVMNEVGSGVREVGIQWSSGTIGVAEEHISSERLLRALAAIHDSVPISPESPVCLLSCVEGETHTIGLALLQVCLREAGWATTWVGASLPLDALCSIITKEKPKMVGLSASISYGDAESLAKQTHNVASICRKNGTKLILGGNGPWPELGPEFKKLHIGVRFGDFQQVFEFAREVTK